MLRLLRCLSCAKAFEMTADMTVLRIGPACGNDIVLKGDRACTAPRICMKVNKNNLSFRRLVLGLSIAFTLSIIVFADSLVAARFIWTPVAQENGDLREKSAAKRLIAEHEIIFAAPDLSDGALTDASVAALLFIAESFSVNGKRQIDESLLYDPGSAFAGALFFRDSLIEQRFRAFRLSFETVFEVEAIRNMINEEAGFARIWLRLREMSTLADYDEPSVSILHYDVVLRLTEAGWKIVWATGEESFSVLIEEEEAGIEEFLLGAYYTHANAGLWFDYEPELWEAEAIFHECENFRYADQEAVTAFEIENIRREQLFGKSVFYYEDLSVAFDEDVFAGDEGGGDDNPDREDEIAGSEDGRENLFEEGEDLFIDGEDVSDPSLEAGAEENAPGEEEERPLQSIDRQAMFEYQKRYALSRNPAWPDFEPPLYSDCQNYASQVVFSGGVPFDLEGLYNWYYFDMLDRSPAWSGVLAKYEYLVWSEDPGLIVQQVTDPAELSSGDLVMIDTIGDGLLNHTVTVYRSGHSPTVSAHSPDMINRPLFSFAGEKVFFHLLGFDHIEIDPAAVETQMSGETDDLEP